MTTIRQLLADARKQAVSDVLNGRALRPTEHNRAARHDMAVKMCLGRLVTPLWETMLVTLTAYDDAVADATHDYGAP